MAAHGAAREGLVDQLKGLDTRFWIVNVMEMFERLAYYGVRTVIPLYIVLSTEQGGPEFTHEQKGFIFAWWALVQSLLPTFTGGLADRYGHKRTIVFAILLKIVGYVLMAYRLDFPGFFAGCMLLAAGTAIFKPGVQGTLAATLKASSASVGWGIFYQLVNIGGFVGPVLAGVLRLLEWQYVFLSCAIIVAINFLWLPFYKDPTQGDEGHGDTSTAAVSQRLGAKMVTAWTAIWSAASAALLALVLTAGLSAEGPAVIVAGVGLAGALGALALMNQRLGAWLMLVAFASLIGAVAFVPAEVRQALESEGGLTGVAAGWATQVTSWAWLVPLFAAAFLAYRVDKPAYDAGRQDFLGVVIGSMVGLFQHRVLSFCLVFSGFWVLFNQFFDLLPNSIDDWVDSSGIIASLGAAFAMSWVPPVLAALLAVLYGGLCAVCVLLALRPDQRPASEAGAPAYAVVLLSLYGAAYAVASWLLGGGSSGPLAVHGAALGIAAVLTVAAFATRMHAKVPAGAGFVLGLVGGFFALQGYFTESAATLTQLAAEGAQVNPEWLINLNPGLIVFTMVFFGYLTSFVSPLTSIIIGMVIATVGAVLAGVAVVGWICLAGVFVFSIGEMLSSPKKMEYLATLSPKGQEGLFMGYANIPVAIGWIAGSLIAGSAYEEKGDKANLAKKFLETEHGVSPAALDGLPRSEAFHSLAAKLDTPAIEAQRLLHETYDPGQVWIPIGALGAASVVGMLIYDQVLRRIDKRAKA